MKKPSLFMDFETYCDISVVQVGSAKYSRHPSCEVLVLSYRLPGGRMKRWVPSGVRPGVGIDDKYKPEPKIPQDLHDYIANTDGYIHAWNAMFEKDIWQNVVVPKHGAPPIDYSRFRCTAAKAAGASLPRALGKAGAALQMAEQKDTDGGRLLRKFAMPRKPTKLDKRTRIYPWDEPDEFERLCKYCDQDVVAEYSIDQVLPDMLPFEWTMYRMDLEMNERGIRLDMPAVRKGLETLTALEKANGDKVLALTGGIRASQRDKFLTHLQKELNLELDNLQAKTLKDLIAIKGKHLPPTTVQLIQLRLEGSKASTKKLKKMMQVACDDDIVRGAFLFNGAIPTARHAGRLIQPQNFPRGELEVDELYEIFSLLHEAGPKVFSLLYKWPIDAIAQAMRGFIMAPPGYRFVVCDFSAIEARVLAWMAGETWMIEAYEQNADLYKRMAVDLYQLPNEDAVEKWQRKFAKDIVLGCGYQLGGVGFQSNCLKRGIVIEEEESTRLVRGYREKAPKVKRFWYDIERACIQAVETEATEDNPIRCRYVECFMDDIWFCIKLPSGRIMRYPYPKVEMGVRFDKPVKKLTYKTEYKVKWVRESVYGGKLTGNICQGIARDIMVHSWWQCQKRGYPIVGTVHDELIALMKDGVGSGEEMADIMRIRPKWAKGAPINAEPFESIRYRK